MERALIWFMRVLIICAVLSAAISATKDFPALINNEQRRR